MNKQQLITAAVVGILTGLAPLQAATACNSCKCGKKMDGSSNQASSCQCAGGCGGQSASSQAGFQLAQGTGQQETKQGESKPNVPRSEAIEVGNKICPVTGNPVDDGKMDETEGSAKQVVKYEYNGKIYNLCCKMCIKDFQKDPEKYSKIAEEEIKNSAKPTATEGSVQRGFALQAEEMSPHGHPNHDH
jgi:YHS domain-containing protein